ncbi:CDP-diacylglycerol--serine O-phosphatidyltransferase [Tepidiphilus succinatimandens]|uniref:CDP-diacylglycerol--serine O-phosphatidyltransferase n=1 Tax=Tepidiphilus succinatimandens TaxID=224436 RepID=UPI00112F0196|nr:CDP-diacylglycerol--serine O-phosphatidyltransferase [Tepidiphilus succinatimandens]
MSEEHEYTTPPKRRGIYLLPNLFTTAALFAGFYAVVQALDGQFQTAAVAIFAAIVLDGLDGRIARLTHTQSEFGAQYDSLADMVSFGVAPAVLSYTWALQPLGKIGWIVAFLYCAGAALRLARFNTNLGVIDKRYFQGLPSPAAAALVAGFAWVAHDLGWTGAELRWPAALLTAFAGISMVTNILYWSGKSIDLRRSFPFVAAASVVLSFALVSIYPGLLFLLFLGYALSGYVLAFWRWRHKRRHSADASPQP